MKVTLYAIQEVATGKYFNIMDYLETHDLEDPYWDTPEEFDETNLENDEEFIRELSGQIPGTKVVEFTIDV